MAMWPERGWDGPQCSVQWDAWEWSLSSQEAAPFSPFPEVPSADQEKAPGDWSLSSQEGPLPAEVPSTLLPVRALHQALAEALRSNEALQRRMEAQRLDHQQALETAQQRMETQVKPHLARLVSSVKEMWPLLRCGSGPEYQRQFIQLQMSLRALAAAGMLPLESS
ncbi:unnamed protein product [Symbiodinium sp. CCMP2592]|nr:unnamed protein product [Symbiodinium sp. CCMP2592]